MDGASVRTFEARAAGTGGAPPPPVPGPPVAVPPAGCAAVPEVLDGVGWSDRAEVLDGVGWSDRAEVLDGVGWSDRAEVLDGVGWSDRVEVPDRPVAPDPPGAVEPGRVPASRALKKFFISLLTYERYFRLWGRSTPGACAAQGPRAGRPADRRIGVKATHPHG
ncbi:hypothetical protein SCWH03_30270 [Streptomyces pacificus]|uniref:Uncharacterized protein n=1 Tax=Streptomyces pacificus TaxID=2705029 RepID=A0A6A0AXU3_9ACTN|nr:hypothetical protein SCWH03_30270 [Streptomyces pacificus]